MFARKLINFVFILFVAAAVVFGFLCIPLINGVINCYDRSILSFDDVEVSSRSFGWSRLRVCEVKRNAIITAETCVDDVRGRSPIPHDLQTKVIDALPLFRPTSENIETRKINHDSECTDYPGVQFYPSY
jgi:hypothetical protein